MQALEKRLAELEAKIDRVARGNVVSGTVIGNDTAAGTVKMELIDPDGTIKHVDFPVATNYLPEAGSTAVVHMNGTNPMVIPLNGETVAVDGSWLRSPNYVAGVSGWKIDADGTAEFNNVVVRGTLSAGTIGRADLVASSYAGDQTFIFPTLANGTFDVNTTGWSQAPTAATTTIARVTTPVFAGAGACSVTNASGATGRIGIISPTGTSGLAIGGGQQFEIEARVRAATTARACRLNAIFYDAAGAAITTWAAIGLPGWEGMTYTKNDNNTGYTLVATNVTAPPRARYVALLCTIDGTANGETHYIDSINITGGSNTGFCPDADPDGTYFNDEGQVTGGQNPLGGWVSIGADFWGTGRAANSGSSALAGCPQIGGFTTCVGGRAYTVTSQRMATGSTTGVTVRAFMSFYDASSNFLGVKKSGRTFFAPAALGEADDYEHSFLAPDGAAYCYYGWQAEPSGVATARAQVLDVTDVRLYETSLITGAVETPAVQAGSGLFPPGMITPYIGVLGNTAWEPFNGWLVCAGERFAIAAYPDLYAVIGITCGALVSGTFAVPDLRGKTLIGLDNMLGTDAGILTVANTLGATGGEESHVLTSGEMPSHNHGALGNGQGFIVNGSGVGLNIGGGQQLAATTANAGGGGGHNNLPPYMLVNWLIKT